MTKNNKLCLPIDIINIIVEYSEIRCYRCPRNKKKHNNRKYYKEKDIKLFCNDEFYYKLCCSKCTIYDIKYSNTYYSILSIDDIMDSIEQNIRKVNLIIELREYYCINKKLINYDEDVIKKEVIKNVKNKINEILNEKYNCYYMASPNELKKLLLKY